MKFIEIDDVSLNLLHNDNESDCYKLQKRQEAKTLHLIFQLMLS